MNDVIPVIRINVYFFSARFFNPRTVKPIMWPFNKKKKAGTESKTTAKEPSQQPKSAEPAAESQSTSPLPGAPKTKSAEGKTSGTGKSKKTKSSDSGAKKESAGKSASEGTKAKKTTKKE